MPQTSEPDDFESIDDLDSYGLDGDPAFEGDDIDPIDLEGVDELSVDQDDDEDTAHAQGVQSTRPMLGISLAGKLDDARIDKFIDAELLGGWTADSVAAFLNGLNPDTPNMISLGSFDPPRRKKTNWRGASGAPGDLDYRDSTGKHCALPNGLREAFQDAMQRARNGDALPFFLPNVWHFTPRGVRVFFLLKQPVETARAYNEFASRVKAQLVALLQWANIAIASKGTAGFEIDPAAGQVAQFMFGPRGIVKSKDGSTQQRDEMTHVGSRSLVELVASPPATPSAVSMAAWKEDWRWKAESIGLNGLARVSLIDSSGTVIHEAPMILTDDAARCLFASAVAVMLPAEADAEKACWRDLVAFGWMPGAIDVLEHRSAVLPEDEQHEYRLQGEAIVEIVYLPGKDGAKGKVIEKLLTNFRVQIVGDVLRDDGFEPVRRMQLASSLNGTKREFELDAHEFGRPRIWAVERVGAGARISIYAPDREVCDAVQAVSTGVPTTTIFLQTGWRMSDGRACFLTTGDVLGEHGSVTDVRVETSPQLRPYALSWGPVNDDLRAAVRASLSLLDVGPAEIMVPLLGVTYLAPIEAARFVTHCYGLTGTLKTSTVALALSHFTGTYNLEGFPARWSDTITSLELILAEAADVVIGVDEFVPGTNYFEARGLQGKFERIAQGVANGGFRSRATREAKLRPFKTPRATVISTGEQMPLLTSVRARTLNLEFGRGAIDSGKLTEAQRIASTGVFGRAMAGYIAYLAKAGRREDARNQIKKYGEQLRKLLPAGHLRIVPNLAQIMGGFMALLQFAMEIKAISRKEAKEQFDRAMNAVRVLAAKQRELVDTSDPAQHFLELLRAALDGHLAYLQSATEDGRGYPGDGRPEGADSLGWIDWNRREAFVLPEVALRLTGRLAEDSGTLLMADKRQLSKALDARQHLATRKKDELIIEKRLFGSKRRVWAIKLDSLLGQDSWSDSNHDE